MQTQAGAGYPKLVTVAAPIFQPGDLAVINPNYGAQSLYCDRTRSVFDTDLFFVSYATVLLVVSVFEKVTDRNVMLLTPHGKVGWKSAEFLEHAPQ